MYGCIWTEHSVLCFSSSKLVCKYNLRLATWDPAYQQNNWDAKWNWERLWEYTIMKFMFEIQTNLHQHIRWTWSPLKLTQYGLQKKLTVRFGCKSMSKTCIDRVQVHREYATIWLQSLQVQDNWGFINLGRVCYFLLRPHWICQGFHILFSTTSVCMICY